MSLDSSREKTGQQSKGPAVPPPLPQERRSPPREIAVTKTATRVQRTEEPTERATTDTSAELTEALVVEDATSPSSSAAVAGRLYRNSQESDYLLISRRRIQAYVLLLMGTGLLGFLLGRGTAGSGRATPATASHAGAQSSSDPVLLAGTVQFAAKGKPLAPDAGAVVVALPLSPPQELLTVEGFRPWNASLASRKDAMDQVASLGGAFAQADTDGGFNLVAPHPGEYYLLIISNNLARPAAVTSRPNRGIEELDFNRLAAFFDRPADLIGPQAYAWTRLEIRPGMAPLRHVFQEGDDLGLDQIGLP
ncbi:MAG: hypothetical protein Kow0040_29870 [Thermogutta sp.]